MIRPLPEAKKREFTTWLRINGTITIIFCSALLFLTAKVLYNSLHLNKSCSALVKQLERHTDKIKSIEFLHQKIKQYNIQKNKFAHYLNNQHPYSLITQIAEIIPEEAFLTRLSYEKNQLELIGQSKSQSAVLAFLKRLDGTPFIKKSDLIALEAGNELDTFHFSIEATLVK